MMRNICVPHLKVRFDTLTFFKNYYLNYKRELSSNFKIWICYFNIFKKLLFKL